MNHKNNNYLTVPKWKCIHLNSTSTNHIVIPHLSHICFWTRDVKILIWNFFDLILIFRNIFSIFVFWKFNNSHDFRQNFPARCRPVHVCTTTISFSIQPSRSRTRLSVYFQYFPSRFHDRRFVENLFFHDDNFYNNTLPPLRGEFDTVSKVLGNYTVIIFMNYEAQNIVVRSYFSPVMHFSGIKTFFRHEVSYYAKRRKKGAFNV